MNITLRAYVRRLKREFGVASADQLARRVVSELGESAATYWMKMYVDLLAVKSDFGENVPRFAAWAARHPSEVRLLWDDARALTKISNSMPGDGWARLRAWLEPSLRKRPRRTTARPVSPVASRKTRAGSTQRGA